MEKKDTKKELNKKDVDVQKTQKKTRVRKKIKKRNTPKKRDIYDLYCLWRSMPTFLKNPDKLMMKGGSIETFHQKMGIDDERILELAKIKTQGEFAKKFGVGIDITTDWNKRMYEEGRDEFSDTCNLMNKMTKNILLAHYNKAIRKFDPYTAELWYKVVAGWNEKQEIKHTGQMTFVEVVRARRAKEDKIKKDAKRQRSST